MRLTSSHARFSAFSAAHFLNEAAHGWALALALALGIRNYFWAC
jgi:hypothetical protein